MTEIIHRKAGILERGFTIAALLCFADAFVSPFLAYLGMAVDPGDSNFVGMLLFNGISLVTIYLIWPCVGDVIDAMWREKFLVCLLGVIFLSTIWSDNPFITFRRAIGVSGTTLFGLYLATRYDVEEQLHLLAITLGIAVIASILIGAISSSHGIGNQLLMDAPNGKLVEVHEGAWRGVFFNKNVLGRIMLLSAIVVISVSTNNGIYRIVKWGLFGLSLILIILSTSKTALLSLLALMGVLQVVKLYKLHFHLRIAIYCLLVCSVIVGTLLLFDNSRAVLAVMGRDETFSGRTELWTAVWDIILKRPLLGYGYNSFWITGGRAERIWDIIGWAAPHAHNGFLDLWLHLGLLGLLLFFGSIFRAIRISTRRICSASQSSAFWPLIFFSFMLISNLTESAILKNNSIFWVLYVSTTVSIYFWGNRSREHTIS